VFVLLNTKEDILNNVCDQTVVGHHWLIGEKIIWKSMVPHNCLVTNIIQNIFFCVQQNKHIYTGLE